MYLSIDHPSIACRDLRKMVDWYCQTFAMKVIVDDGNAVLIGYDDTVSGGAMIEMGPATDAGPAQGQFGRMQPGIRHVALRVSDFDGAYAKLQRLGVSFVTDAPGQALGGGKTILFRDPEGNELQIVQR
ncbi:MAG TPA: VOC family protein [Tepidisphaeraceae bacterium]|jgi:catechol 2,3-dioxygenase-like lactoylglutathione lyase family enzyme|nr:VOC family protein [Tepidisphaeraceae bacterium]